jgi:predicted metal-dependent phosphotriesterase family hydrolase
MPVTTVLGPITPDAVGLALMHEHLIHAVEPEPFEDEATTVRELESFRAARGRTIVDLTTVGIGGPRPEALARVAAATGLAVVAGTGFYIEDRVPDSVRALSGEELYDWLVRDLTAGFPGTAIRAGIIGEIGCGTRTSSEITPFEERVLRAAARAQAATTATITIHTQIDEGPQGLWILDVLVDAGADLSRVVLAHSDARIDPPYWRALIERGAILEFSAIGRIRHAGTLLDGTTVPDGDARVAAVADLVVAGYADRLLLSHDVCERSHLRSFGGGGFASLMTEVIPRLRTAGVTDAALQTMLVDNPARLLDVA